MPESGLIVPAGVDFVIDPAGLVDQGMLNQIGERMTLMREMILYGALMTETKTPPGLAARGRGGADQIRSCA